MNINSRFAALTTVAIAAATLVPALPAMAKDGDVIRRGDCAGSTDWKIKASPEDGRIEVESEIDSNVNGQNWTWVLKHNGTNSANGSSVTRAPSGSFEVRRVVVNLAGADALVFRATNNRTGEVCRATVSF